MPIFSRRLLAGILLLSMLSMALSAQAAAEVTEQDLKRMRIRELQAFLDERGLDCTGCQEKADFVRMAVANKDKKPLASRARREVPDVPFWDAWKSTARSVCLGVAEKRGVETSAAETVCDTIASAVEGFLIQHGKRTASKLRKKADALLKTSFKDIYYDAGVALFERLSHRCMASAEKQEECSSLGKLLKILESGGAAGDFTVWLTNVGIENTNPMYALLASEDL